MPPAIISGVGSFSLVLFSLVLAGISATPADPGTGSFDGEILLSLLVLRQQQRVAGSLALHGLQAHHPSSGSWTGRGHSKGPKAAQWGEADLQDRSLPLYPCFPLPFMLSFFSFLFSSSPNMKEPFSRKPLCGLFCKLQTKAFLYPKDKQMSCPLLNRGSSI